MSTTGGSFWISDVINIGSTIQICAGPGFCVLGSIPSSSGGYPGGDIYNSYIIWNPTL